MSEQSYIGDIGPPGNIGPTGPKGPLGEAGDQGDPGNSNIWSSFEELKTQHSNSLIFCANKNCILPKNLKARQIIENLDNFKIELTEKLNEVNTLYDTLIQDNSHVVLEDLAHSNKFLSITNNTASLTTPPRGIHDAQIFNIKKN